MINKHSVIIAFVLGIVLGLGNVLGQMEAKAATYPYDKNLDRIAAALEAQMKATKELTEVMQCNCGRR